MQFNKLTSIKTRTCVPADINWALAVKKPIFQFQSWVIFRSSSLLKVEQKYHLPASIM